ncbi:MAG TPA: DNA polymerase III subunit delta [Allosphingosinicella sp.]|nr:DNA polymerase III subunit delta [Allosphingosinicella sp.]
MKANRPQIEGALKAPGADIRLFLLYGPDEAGSRALADLLAAARGPGGERVDLSGPDLKADPARLADEAASLSLFGGLRTIRVEPAGDEALAAVEALLDAPAAGNPVALVAGTLKPASKLLKLVLAAPNALAFASYAPEGREADALVIELGRAHGLQIKGDVARRIADAAGGDRALIGQELVKFATYSDAEVDRPKPLSDEIVDAVGAGRDEGDLGRLVDAVAGGNAAMLHAELIRLRSECVEGIALVRAVLRRMALLARLRAEAEAGTSIAAVMAGQGRSIFFKEKDAVAAQLSRWRSGPLARSMSRLLEAERQVKLPGALGPLAVDEELFAICRQAARLR